MMGAWRLTGLNKRVRVEEVLKGHTGEVEGEKTTIHPPRRSEYPAGVGGSLQRRGSILVGSSLSWSVLCCTVWVAGYVCI